MVEPSLRVDGVSFSYPGSEAAALADVSFTVGRGSRFGILGPNGAGKTTLIHLMNGLFRPTSGKISIHGAWAPNNKQARRICGFVPQLFSFYPELTGAENLHFFAAVSGLNRSEIKSAAGKLLAKLGLEEKADKPAKSYSGGMKRRLNLGIGLIHQPEILFLDEPTEGIDVQSRKFIHELLLALNRLGTTIVYTSHYLDEAEALCRELIIMDEGKIVAKGATEDLLIHHQKEGLEDLFLGLTGSKLREP